jgi:hypothetical protein
MLTTDETNHEKIVNYTTCIRRNKSKFIRGVWVILNYLWDLIELIFYIEVKLSKVVHTCQWMQLPCLFFSLF